MNCECLKFRLQSVIEDADCPQIEPYITSLALYDAKHGRKLTENFYFDLNHESIRKSTLVRSPSLSKGGEPDSSLNSNVILNKLPQNWLTYTKRAIVNVSVPHPEIYVVVRIEKILQGSINQVAEPYLKMTKGDPKNSQKLLKNIKMYAQKIGHFRMPFAWAARPIYRMYSNDLDETIDFPAIYRQEGNKLKDEDLLKLLADYKKPEKFSKLTVIPGELKIRLKTMTEMPDNCLTTSLKPLSPFPMPPTAEPTIELNEFLGGQSEREAHPFATFLNHLFIYPTSLLFDSQKSFSRARNIAVMVELKDCDLENSKSIAVGIYLVI